MKGSNILDTWEGDRGRERERERGRERGRAVDWEAGISYTVKQISNQSVRDFLTWLHCGQSRVDLSWPWKTLTTTLWFLWRYLNHDSSATSWGGEAEGEGEGEGEGGERDITISSSLV